MYNRLLQHTDVAPNHAMRGRWKLSIPEGILARRFINHFRVLADLVAPQVLSACWRTAWNGWRTDARLRNMEARHDTKAYVLGCSSTAEDRIEHYARCLHIIHFAGNCLRIPPEKVHFVRFSVMRAQLVQGPSSVSCGACARHFSFGAPQSGSPITIAIHYL